MEATLNSIYEYLQIYELKLSEKTAIKFKIEEEIESEKIKHRSLQREIDSLERRVSGLQEKLADGLAKRDMRRVALNIMEEEKKEKSATLLDKQRNKYDRSEDLERTVEKYVKLALDFHDEVNLESRNFPKISENSKEKCFQTSLEAEAMQCELKLRQDLMKEMKTLEQALQESQMTLSCIEAESSDRRQRMVDRIHEANRIRIEVSDPRKIPDIVRLEKKLCDTESELDMLKSGLIALQDEKRKALEQRNKRAFVTPMSNKSNFRFRSTREQIPAMVFTRDQFKD